MIDVAEERGQNMLPKLGPQADDPSLVGCSCWHTSQ